MVSFEKFAKINDRHFKRVRAQPRISSAAEARARAQGKVTEPRVAVELDTDQDLTSRSNDYFGTLESSEAIDFAEDNDELSAAEAGFLRGALQA